MPEILPQQYSQPLLELRELYYSQQKEYENAINDLRIKIMHIDALLESNSPSFSAAIIEPERPAIAAASEVETSKSVQEPSLVLKALPRFKEMTQVEAVRKIFEENAGDALHLNFLVESYYGKIIEGLFPKAKSRIATVIKTGLQRKLWQRVPKSVGYYTLDRKLLDKNSG